MGRPDKNYATDAVTRQLQTAVVLLTAVTTAILVWQALTRDEPVPITYLLGDEIDYELQTGALLPLIFIALAFTGGTMLMSFAPAFGRFPVTVTKENVDRLYKASERLHAWIGLGVQLTVSVGLIMLLLQDRVVLIVMLIPALLTAVVWFRGYAAMAREEFTRREIRGDG
ncbi:hypothetical protein [uncultured Agrococcus sp.]|uniref:hypothetical protein n=1 Tax=uncultured Agrococcus sp. TaxID=382258 RepID=UPI0025EB1107|nr:hypothetical protein [uncultured Agrococcus sp.]